MNNQRKFCIFGLSLLISLSLLVMSVSCETESSVPAGDLANTSWQTSNGEYTIEIGDYVCLASYKGTIGTEAANFTVKCSSGSVAFTVSETIGEYKAGTEYKYTYTRSGSTLALNSTNSVKLIPTGNWTKVNK